MFDKKQKSCVKCIHLETDDGLCNRKAFYIVKIVFHLSSFKTLFPRFRGNEKILWGIQRKTAGYYTVKEFDICSFA